MRGNPLLRSTAMAVLLALLAGMVWLVTARAGSTAADLTASGASTVPSPKPALDASTVHVEADFAPAPQQFTLKYLGQILATADHPGSHWQGNITLAVRNDPAELVIEANWPTNTDSSALRLQLQTPGQPSTEKTYWSKDHLLEVIQLH